MAEAEFTIKKFTAKTYSVMINYTIWALKNA